MYINLWYSPPVHSLHIVYICAVTSCKNSEFRNFGQLLGLDRVGLVIKKGRLRWFGHVERTDDAD